MSLKLQGTFNLPKSVAEEFVDGTISERAFCFHHEDGHEQFLFVRRVVNRPDVTNVHVIVGKLLVNGEEKQISFSYYQSQTVVRGQVNMDYTIEDQLELQLIYDDPSSDGNLGKDLG